MVPRDGHVGRPGVRQVDEGLVAALLRGATWEDAATTAGCSRSTVARRLADPEFRARLDDARAEHLRRVADRLMDASIIAIDTLITVMTDGEAAASARTAAARAVLDLAARYRELVDLDARVAALEARDDPRVSARGVA